MTTNSLITQFVLPDFFSHIPYSLHKGPRFEDQAREAEEFILGTLGYTGERRAALLNIKVREFVEYVYPVTDPARYRAAFVFVAWTFSIDDWMDISEPSLARQHAQACFNVILDPDLQLAADDKLGNLTKGWMVPFAQNAYTSVRRRFAHEVKLTLQAMGLEAEHRDACHTPDIETYIAYRHNAGGVIPCLCIAQFTGGFAVPEHVLEHSSIKSLEKATSHYVIWINDLFSYNKEVGEGHTYNLVSVVMKEKNYGLQEAVDYVGQRCNECIDMFEDHLKQLPSWGEETDEVVAKYILAMKHWMWGTLNWSFASERYFGKDGPEVKKNRIVKLHPNLVKEFNGLQTRSPISLDYVARISGLIVNGKGFLEWLICHAKGFLDSVIGKRRLE